MKTLKKSFKENPFNLKENRLIFMGGETPDGGAPGKITITSASAEVDKVRGSEVENFGCDAGTKVDDYSSGLYTLSDGSFIQEIEVGGGEKKLLRLKGEQYFNEAGGEVKLEKTAEVKKEIEKIYEEKSKQLKAVKDQEKARVEEVLEGEYKDDALKNCDRVFEETMNAFGALKDKKLGELGETDKIKKETAEKITGVFAVEAGKLEWDSASSAAELNADVAKTLKEIKDGKDMKEWMKDAENKKLMRTHLLGLDGAAPTTQATLKVNFKNAQAKLGLTDKQKQALEYGVSIGNLFSDNELTHISKVSGKQGSTGGGAREDNDTAKYYDDENGRKRGVYNARKKKLLIWDGSEINFSEKTIEKLPAETASGGASAASETAPVAASDTASVETSEPGKAPAPASLPEMKEGEEKKVLGKTVEAVEGGKVKVEGVDKPLDKKEAEVVLGVKEATPEFNKDQLKKAFPHIEQKNLKGEPVYDRDEKTITATYETDGAILEVKYDVDDKTTSIETESGDINKLLKNSDAAFAWFMRKCADKTLYKTEDETKKLITEGNWKEALESMLGDKGKVSLDLVALCLEEYTGSATDVMNSTNLQKHIEKMIPLFDESFLTESNYDNLKGFCAGGKLSGKEMSAYLARVKVLDEVEIDLVKELLTDTENSDDVVKILLENKTGLTVQDNFVDLETEVPGITDILDKFQEKNSTDNVQEVILKTIVNEVLDDLGTPKTAVEQTKAKKYAKYLESHLKNNGCLKEDGDVDEVKAEEYAYIYELLHSSDLTKTPDSKSEDINTWAKYRLAKLGTTPGKAFYQADLFRNLAKNEQEKAIKALASEFGKIKDSEIGDLSTDAATAKIEIAIATKTAELLKKGTPEEKYLAYKIEEKIGAHAEKGDFKFDKGARLADYYKNRKSLPIDLRLKVLEDIKTHCSDENISLDDSKSSTDFVKDLEQEIAETKYEKGDYKGVSSYMKDDDPRKTFVEAFNTPSDLDQAKLSTITKAYKEGKLKRDAVEKLYEEIKDVDSVDDKYKAMLAIELGYIGAAQKIVDDMNAGFTKDYLSLRLDPKEEYDKLIDLTGRCVKDFADTEENYLQIEALVRLFNLSKGKDNEAQVKAKLDSLQLLTSMRNITDTDFKGYSKEKQAQILEGLRVLVQTRGASEIKYVDQLNDFYDYFRLKGNSLTAEEKKEGKDPFDKQDYAWMKDMTKALNKMEKTDIEAKGEEKYAKMALLLFKKEKDVSLLKVEGDWMPDAWVEKIDTDDDSKYLKYLFYKATGNYDKAAENATDAKAVLDDQLSAAGEDPVKLKEAGDDYDTAGHYNEAVGVYLKALGKVVKESADEQAILDKIAAIFKDDAKKGKVLIENRIKVADYYKSAKGYTEAAKIYNDNDRPNELMKLYEENYEEMVVETLNFDYLNAFATSGKLKSKRIIDLLKKSGVDMVISGDADKRKSFGKTHKDEILRIRSDEDKKNVLNALGFDTVEDFNTYVAASDAAVRNMLAAIGQSWFGKNMDSIRQLMA